KASMFISRMPSSAVPRSASSSRLRSPGAIGFRSSWLTDSSIPLGSKGAIIPDPAPPRTCRTSLRPRTDPAGGPAASLAAPLPPRYPDRRTSGFVHLHVHTEFSLADSTIRVPAKPDQADPAKAKQPNLLSRAVELGFPALAVTDLNNLFALIKFYKAAEAVGIKPVAGADLVVAGAPGETPWRMTALVRDHGGYLNLSRLLTRAWMEGHRLEGGVAVRPEWVRECGQGLILLAGRESLAGRLAAENRHELAQQQLADWQRDFDGNLCLE